MTLSAGQGFPQSLIANTSFSSSLIAMILQMNCYTGCSFFKRVSMSRCRDAAELMLGMRQSTAIAIEPICISVLLQN